MKRRPQIDLAELADKKQACVRIIDAGFKALAIKMHPDKPGGSDEAFKRLKIARDELKERM